MTIVPTTGAEKSVACDDQHSISNGRAGVDMASPFRRAAPMTPRAEEFHGLVDALLRRFFRQNGQPTPDPTSIAAISTRLWALIAQRGLPASLRPDQRGQPHEMSEAESQALVGRVLDSCNDALLADAVRQLVKACFYPEFRDCRESYRATGADGACRRQDPARAQRRISGSHCVDCPYWQSLAPAEHEHFLATQWYAGTEDFMARRDVFLPEDFRALRRWIRAQAPR
jgi:hypothetical protein